MEQCCYYSVTRERKQRLCLGLVCQSCIERDLDFNQENEQAGYRSGFSTMEQLNILNEGVERSNKYELPLYLGFIDFGGRKKNFDSAYLAAVFNHLKNKT